MHSIGSLAAGSVAGALTLIAGLAGAQATVEDTARGVVHLLDYIAVDYAAAVEDGWVRDEVEYREQLEFEFAFPDDALLGEYRIELQAAAAAISSAWRGCRPASAASSSPPIANASPTA